VFRFVKLSELEASEGPTDSDHMNARRIRDIVATGQMLVSMVMIIFGVVFGNVEVCGCIRRHSVSVLNGIP
jgi:hypothetical protein